MLEFSWLNESDQAKKIRDRFIQFAVERLKLSAVDRDKCVNLPIDEWRGKSEDIAHLLADLVKEFRTA